MSENATFGSWLKNRRKVLDLTQDDLAQRVDCSLTLIRKIEADERRPSKQIAELLAARLDIPADERSDFVRFARSTSAHFSLIEKSPWRTLRHHLTNLPVPPTPVFGREQEIADIARQMTHDRVRLLTLVGPPGVGKTRLALACAEELLNHFDEGVYWVPLAPLKEPDRVAPTLARALGVKEIAGQTWLTLLTQHLAPRRVLLVLDNFEHIIAVAPFVAELLAVCPHLHIVVTSRVSLHVRAERQFRVAPLAPSFAVELFLDRLHAVEPNCVPSLEEISALAQICAHLDGLPLAIELVASRTNALSPHALLAQIEQRLALATEGPRDVPARHQTLRNAIAWSEDLLDAVSRSVFARMAIFVSGWTTEMACAICGQDIAEVAVKRALSTLANASLIVKETASNGEPRWSMLETIREYAAEQLATTDQADEMAHRHAHCFLAFAESAAPHLSGPHQVEWLDRLERDHPNLHAALDWAVERGEAEIALRLGGALFLFWYKQGRLIEGRSWLKRALALPAALTVAPSVRQNALHGASVLAWSHADFVQAQHLAEESHALAGDIGDRAAIATALHVLANVATDTSDYPRAIALHEQTLALRRDLGDKAGIASSLNNLGRIAYYRGAAAQAVKYYEESLALQRELGDQFGIALALNNLGSALADNLQELDRAASLLQESLALSREPSAKFFLVPYTIGNLGRVALCAGDYKSAQTILTESLSVARRAESKTGTAFTQLQLAQLALDRGEPEHALEPLREGLTLQREFPEQGVAIRFLAIAAYLLQAQRKTERAAILLGAVEGLSESASVCLPLAYQRRHAEIALSIQMKLDEGTYRAAWQLGHAMTINQAFDFALETTE